MRTKPGAAKRGAADIRHHYQVEKELATRLKRAPRNDRLSLYGLLYDELYRKVPDHPQLTRREQANQTHAVKRQLEIINPFLNRKCTFMEIGPGDCSLSLEVAKRAAHVFAIDVSKEIVNQIDPPTNFTLHLSDGVSIPVANSTIDVAYSNQLMEHLHPEDAFEQLKNIYLSLKPGGVYICITPNGLTGPHDISKYFDPVAQGFHLKEYSVLELKNLLKKVGFEKTTNVVRLKRLQIRIPADILSRFESVFGAAPYGVRTRYGSRFPLRSFFDSIIMIARKAV